MSMYRYAGRPGRARVTSRAVVIAVACACSRDAADTTAPDEPAATTASVTEFVIPRANAFPHDPALAPDGVVWYTDQTNSYIGELNPATGKITDIATPTPGSGRTALMSRRTA